MAGEASKYGADIMLDYLSGRNSLYTGARTMYVSLGRSVASGGVAPTDTQAATELAVSGYARQTFGPTAPAGDPSRFENTALITFGPFLADPPEIAYVELWDASTGGNRVWWWVADLARDPTISESIQIPAGLLYGTLD